MATAGEKARPMVRAAVGNQKVIVEIAGNNRYVAATEETVYVGSVGISSGSFGGQSLKRYQVDDITSVDVRSAFMTVEMELVISGGSESRRTNAAFTDRMRNENVIMFQKGQLGQVQYVAHIIMDIKQWRRRQARQPPPPQVVHAPAPPTFPEQIRQLAHLKDAGILSAEEFESKKRELLQRM